MEIKIVLKIKNWLLIFCLFLFINSAYTQSKKEIYFLIDKSDTLIKKQTATEINSYEGYIIIDKKSIVKKTRSKNKKKPDSLILKKDEIWISTGDDIEYNSYENFHFLFHNENDTIVSEKYIDSLKPVRSRRTFLNLKNKIYNPSTRIFFIEPIICRDKYILREVFPVTLE